MTESTEQFTIVPGVLHGVGVTVVNSLSEWCEVDVSRDGFVYHQEYAHKKQSRNRKIAIPKEPGTERYSAQSPGGRCYDEKCWRYENKFVSSI